MSFALTGRQALLLAALTLVWGVNWPVMKSAISGFPPLTFRTLSMWLGLPVPYLATRVMKVPLRVERRDRRELGSLTVTNMVIWYAVAIVASGAWWLSEQLHWQEFAAMLLMLAAIASVLWPARAARV